MDQWSKTDRVSVQDYLASEVRSPARREYVGGVPYAMAGAGNAHCRIASNVQGWFWLRLRGTPCESFNSDAKVRVRLSGEERFYYPDAMVTCSPNPQRQAFQEEPTVVVEVMSPETRRIDEGEKLLAYQAIPSLRAYLLVEQSAARIVVVRRTAHGFVREVHAGRDASVPLPEIGCELPLAEVYDRVVFEE